MDLRKPGVAAMLVLATISLACSPSPSPSLSGSARGDQGTAALLQPPSATLPDGTVILLEIAETPDEHQRGLMFRSHLDPNRGMLFLFDQPGFPSFWMKDTWIPLDMVFLDTGGRVTDLAASVPPCPSEPCPEYSPAKLSSAVLELNAGTAARHGITPGAVLRFDGVPSLVSGH